MDFTGYIRAQVEAFEKKDPSCPGEPPLGDYYVETKALCSKEDASEHEIASIHRYIVDWISQDSVPHIALLGEYGTGKTSLCRKIAYELAIDHFNTDGVSRIPILFNLRDFTKTLSLESLVTSFLDEQCGVLNPRFRLFKAMNDSGVFVLIFDGFDEMAIRVDADTLEANLAEIDRLAAPENAKVVLTSRIEYFTTAEEETASLRPKGQLLATRNAEYQAITIQPWDDKQVAEFLKKRVPFITRASQGWTYYRNRIAKIPGLADLSRRPVLLDMIVKTLPKLIESGGPIDRPNLYRTYLLGELRRQKIVKKRQLLLSEDKRFSMLENLALDFCGSEAKSVNFESALDYVREQINPPKSEVESHTRDFLTCSFLIRRGDDFIFSHRSLLEFLAASALVHELETGQPRAFRNMLLESVVAGFLAEMVTNTRRLWYWVRRSRQGDAGKRDYLAGNAVTILCLKNSKALRGKDMSGTVLRGADFGEADILSTDLSSAVLEQCNFDRAKVSRTVMSEARLKNCRFSLYIYGRVADGSPKSASGYTRELTEMYLSLQGRKTRRPFLRSATFSFFSMQKETQIIGYLDVTIPDTKSLTSRKTLVPDPPWIMETALDYPGVLHLFESIPEDLRNRVRTERRFGRMLLGTATGLGQKD